jgi:hypothetical protein
VLLSLEGRGVRLHAGRLARRPRHAAPLVVAAACAALVLAGMPARPSSAVAAPIDPGNVPNIAISRTAGLAPIDLPTGRRIASDLVADLGHAAEALRTRDRAQASKGATGAWLSELWTRIRASRGGTVEVTAYRAEHVRLRLAPGLGQAPPIVVATLTGTSQTTTYGRVPSDVVQRSDARPVVRTFELTLTGNRYLVAAVRGEPARPTARPAPPLQASFTLTDVAATVGLDFRQQGFAFGVNGDETAMMGGGVCWLDYDGDGWVDLYLVNGYSDRDTATWYERGGLPASRLYRNVQGRFEDVTASSGAGLRVRGSGCVAGDLDGNGTTDLFVTTAGYDPGRDAYDALLWNNGDGTFSEGAWKAAIRAHGWHTGAAIADVNDDGRMDVFVAGYTDRDHRITGSEAGFPANFEAVPDLLYLNRGGSGPHPTFREVGRAAGLEPRRLDHGLGASFFDADGDGRLDLYVANDLDPNRLYMNVRRSGGLGFRFVDRGRQDRVADPNAGMGIALGDYSGDGLDDVFVTNSRGQLHAAYRSRADQPFADARPEFVRAVGQRFTGWGATWADLDLDGKLELVLANGAIPVRNLAKDAERLQVVTTDGGTIRPLAAGSVASRNGRGLAAADYDNDGDLDLAVASIGGRVQLLRNDGATGHWLEVALPRFAPGTRVTATLADGRTLVRETRAGSSYLSSEDPRLHFGLGSVPRVRELVVRYPGGGVTRLRNVRADRLVRVGSG